MSNDKPLSDLQPDQVAQYLLENPTFFLKHEQLLADLYLPHSPGQAVSLLERQVSLLRERNIDMRKRLNDMLEQGQRNDLLFQKTTSLVLHLLEAQNLNELVRRLTDYCENEFQVDRVQFSLLTSADSYRNNQCRLLSVMDVERNMPSLLQSPQSISGIFRDDELVLLFAGKPEHIASAIVLPIVVGDKIQAILAMGSDDPHYFKAGMNTLFLGFIGDVIGKLLPRFV